MTESAECPARKRAGSHRTLSWNGISLLGDESLCRSFPLVGAHVSV